MHTRPTPSCIIISTNAIITSTGQYGATENPVAVDSLVNEASFIDPEIPIESSTGENPTPLVGVSGEQESIVIEEICHGQQMDNIGAEQSIGEIDDKSDDQEQNSATSPGKVNSFYRNSFDPTENSTPKSMIEAKCEEKLHQKPCQTSLKNEEKKKPPKAVQKRSVSENLITIKFPNIQTQFRNICMFSFPAKSTQHAFKILHCRK